MASPLQQYRAAQGEKTKVTSPLQQFRATQGSSTSPTSPLSLVRPAKSGDTKSSQGLYNLAVQNGLQGEADRILKTQQGESTNKFWSGGFIMDTIDTLNALQYGVVGVLKGDSFVNGVRNRSSFTDKDALGDKGIPGLIGGIALDIAFDPLTYIAPVTLLKRVPFLSKLGTGIKKAIFGETVIKGVDTGKVYQTAEDAIKDGARTYEAQEGGTKVGRLLVEKLAYKAGKDPIYMDIYEKGTKNTAITIQKIADLGKPIADLTPEVASIILKTDKAGRFMRESLENLAKKLTPDQLAPVAKLYNYIDNLGKEAVDLGLLSKETFEKNMGEYIKNAYLEYEQKTATKSPFGFSKTKISPIKSRKEVENVAEFGLTQVKNPAYLLMKSAIDLTRNVENAKMFKQVAEKFGSEVPQAGFTKMGDGKSLGALAGKYIPNHMAESLNEIITPATDTIGRYLIANFKFAKVVMNPATHIRNIISNMVLNYWKLGMNPLDPRTIKAQKEALSEIAKGTGKWIDEAKPLGYNLDTFASQEFKNILETPEMTTAMGKAGGSWAKTKKTLGDIYQGEENFAKLTAYIYQRQVKNLNPEDAWKAAESATFNYAQVTPFIRKLRTSIWGMPFITFTYKATPLAIETALKNPGRISVIGKIKKGLENQSDLEMTDRERASEPPWVRDGFYIKLPGEDKYGRSKYFDLTYIIPFGDLVSGSFFERGLATETGTPEGPGQALLRKNPVTQLIMELGKNRNFYGHKIWKDSDPADKQARDMFIHISKTYAPPVLADQLPNGYNAKSGEREWKGVVGGIGASEENQQRTLTEELMRNAGIKIQPMNAEIQETYQEWNKKKALETLLKETGILKGMEINYLPKNE